MTSILCPPPLKLAFTPRRIVLFSGHMMDAPDRSAPRFPPSMMVDARQKIDEALRMLSADAADFALTQGAAGGDILFAESCLQRGVPVQFLLPLPEDEFIAHSIVGTIDGEEWCRRYLALREKLANSPCVMPRAPGDRFERCNAWMVATAFASGAGGIHLVCLWNGEDGDGPGGTAHMVREVERLNGNITWIDTRTLNS